MDKDFLDEPMLDVYIYETRRSIERLEALLSEGEEEDCFAPDTVSEVFRLMHTVKGASAMMLYNNIASLAHALEDLFSYLKEERSVPIDSTYVSDLALEGVDFIRLELEKAEGGAALDGDPASLIASVREFLAFLQGGEEAAFFEGMEPPPAAQHYYLPPVKSGQGGNQKAYEAVIFFEEGCEMENIRAFAILHTLKDVAKEYRYLPEDIIENPHSAQVIREKGFRILLRSDKSLGQLHDFFSGTTFLRHLELNERPDGRLAQWTSVREAGPELAYVQTGSSPAAWGEGEGNASRLNFIGVEMEKLDRLAELTRELLLAEEAVSEKLAERDMVLDGLDQAERRLKEMTVQVRALALSMCEGRKS